MELRDYLRAMPIPKRKDFAVRCGTTYGHIRNVSYGKKCAAELAINIDRESGGEVPVEQMAPYADWGHIRGTAKTANKQFIRCTSEKAGASCG